MKKQFLFIAISITAFLVSCKKESISTTKQEETISADLTLKPIFIDPLKIGLAGRYEFDGNLKDTTGKLPTGVPSGGTDKYTTDRKGQRNHAIWFDSTYGVFISSAPLDTNMSMACWVKTASFPTIFSLCIAEGSQALTFIQLEDKFQGGSWNGVNGQYVVSGSMDQNWHHLAATRDKVSLKFYIDGVLVGTSPTPANSGPTMTSSEYNIGYGFNAGIKYWKGSVDDFRIYKRALSASEVTKLASL